MAMGAVTGGAGRGVPLARRLLGAHPLRVLAGAGGIGLALMLILLLDGLWAGVRGQATLFEDHTGAQLVVVAPGTDSLFADPSVLPAAAVSRVAATPGVDWVAPVPYRLRDLGPARAARRDGARRRHAGPARWPVEALQRPGAARRRRDRPRPALRRPPTGPDRSPAAGARRAAARSRLHRRVCDVH